MAVSNPTIAFDNSTTASFRAWGSAVSTALAAVGLMKTTDTGQIDWTTVAVPGSGVVGGFEMWRLNDAVQSSKPVFVKVEYGTSSVAGRPAMWITYSTGTNGAGTLNGLLISARYAAAGIISAAVPCWFASDGSYLTVVLNSSNAAGTSAAFTFGVFFDRTRDTTGAITADGFQWVMTNCAGSAVASVQHAIRFGSSSASLNDNSNNGSYFTHGIFSFRINAAGAVGSTAGFGTAVYSGALMYQIAVTPAQSSQYLGDTYYYPQLVTCPVISYGLVTLCGYSVDMPPNFTTTVVPVLGSSHTYLVTPYDFSAFGGGGTYMRTLVRYE